MKSTSKQALTKGQKLELVLKCDCAGSEEAVRRVIETLSIPGVEVGVIHSGIGDISDSDLLFAETASKIIIGFQVRTMRSVEKALAAHSVEVRLYDTIYALEAGIKEMAGRLLRRPVEELITGSARIIALFKSSRKGIIIGCEVKEGHLAVGQKFRIISAMGPVYAGTIESMHIKDSAVQKAVPRQQLGIKTRDFKKAKVGGSWKVSGSCLPSRDSRKC
jgi:translation initiation factor IF-2